MSVVNNNLLLTADAGVSQYQISRSLRFNSADSAFFSRTPTVAGNRKTWTWAGWIKRTTLSAFQRLFCDVDSAGVNGFFSGFNSSDSFEFGDYTSTYTSWRVTTQKFRDIAAWFHLIMVYDTTDATAANRLRLYINGIEVTTFSSSVNRTQNADGTIGTTQPLTLGRNGALTAGFYFNGYLADVHFVDGQALTPSSFTETNATTGQLVPKAYGGSYGVNGFRLNFSDNSAATAATLGADSSGNGNNWTPNNLSVTAGAGNDSLTDTPTSYGTDTGAGGEVRGNYATLNPLANGGNTLSDGNLRVVGANNRTTLATIGMSSGKWYCEATAVSFTSFHVGIARGNAEIGGTGDYLGNDANGWSYFQTGQKVTNNSASAYGSSFTTNDVIGIAFDADNGTLVFYKNNVNQGTAFSGLTSGPYFFAIGANLPTAVFNFGQRPFAYAAPSGFKALCDTNLPSPTIAKPNTVMDSLLYTGSGVKTGLNFSPDLVWIKNRSSIFRPNFNDTVRGVNKQLFADGTEAELSLTDCLTAFSSSGFTVGTNGATGFGSATYVAWCWDAGSSTVTNTVGTITSQVRANANAGFGIFTYTGTGANATIGHGLNIAPALVIIKRRDTTSNWQVRHTSVAVANSIQLNLTSAAAAASTVWNSTAPSSTVVSIGTDTTVNASGGTYVGWCFAPVTGYSAFGTYTGNGSADGAFVYLEFRPAFLLIKRTNTTSDWTIFDNKRLGYNVDNNSTYANRSVAESTADLVDITSNGFKLRSTDASVNASGSTYIYAAYAENPFQYARAR
jgi:hypothetical protein